MFALRSGRNSAVSCVWSAVDTLQLQIRRAEVRLSCMCELIPLHPLIFCLGTSVQNREISPFTNWTPNRQQTVESDRCRHTCTYVLMRAYILSWQSEPSHERPYLPCQGQNRSRLSRTVHKRHFSTSGSTAVPLVQTSAAATCVLVPGTFCVPSWPVHVCWWRGLEAEGVSS